MASDEDHPSDRRRAERIPINTEFAAMPSATYISDLSEYGVFVHTPTPSAMGSKIKLRFTVLLDDPVIVEGEGRVVRLQQEPVPGMGIEFTELAPEMILRINDVVSRQRPRDSGPPLPAHEGLDGLGPEGEPEREDDEDDALEAARTLSRGEAPRDAAEVTGTDTTMFRPPPMPGRKPDDDAKTGLYQPVGAAIEDTD